MKAIRLKTEYLHNPIGIDITKPVFFWNCEGGKLQKAFQIIARNEDDKIIWDSGRVEHRAMHTRYDGDELKSRDIIFWKIRLWDEGDEPGGWSFACFEIGLLESCDWQAKWITGDYNPKKRKRYPVDCFRKQFTCGSVSKARLYVSACGLYEAKINGSRVGESLMTPGFTDYNKRIQYQSYDVTKLIIDGRNTISAELADGWYRGSVGAMGVCNVYGTQTKLIAQLEIILLNGIKMIICSDESWQWSADGPLLFADMKDGEIIDMRKSPSYSGWSKLTSHFVIPTASNNVSVKEKEVFPAKLSYAPSGKQILDFGQNLAGIIELRINAAEGDVIILRFAEHLDENGELDMKSIQCRPGKPDATPKQEVTIICKEGENSYKTKFAVFGFRYAETESDIRIKSGSIKAIAVYSDMEQTGHFNCSNKLINRFVENTLWSMKSNFLDVPTDCPTRERSPWTGDVQIFCKTGSYLMDTAAFLRKWLKDLVDRQSAEGKVPCHAPDVRNNEYLKGIDFIKRLDGCCGWSDTIVLVPWLLYQMYGDKSFLIDQYPAMKKHVEFQIGRTNRTGLFGKPFHKPDKKYISNVGQAFGEWLEPEDVYKQSIIKDFCAPHPEEATAYLSYICGIMMEIAELTGNNKDIPPYSKYHQGCRSAYQNQFLPVTSTRQSKLVRPLALGLLDNTVEKTETFKKLEDAIEKRNYRIGTGFLSTPLILPLLTKLGRTDMAYRMMENEDEPGWLYEVKQGATSVWENWDGSASRNHYSPGSVCEWLFETVCGIRIAGENRFIFEPHIGGNLSEAFFSYKSIAGVVACGWKKESGNVRINISVPANTTADIYLPGNRKESNVSAGDYSFACMLKDVDKK